MCVCWIWIWKHVNKHFFYYTCVLIFFISHALNTLRAFISIHLISVVVFIHCNALHFSHSSYIFHSPNVLLLDKYVSIFTLLYFILLYLFSLQLHQWFIRAYTRVLCALKCNAVLGWCFARTNKWTCRIAWKYIPML